MYRRRDTPRLRIPEDVPAHVKEDKDLLSSGTCDSGIFSSSSVELSSGTLDSFSSRALESFSRNASEDDSDSSKLERGNYERMDSGIDVCSCPVSAQTSHVDESKKHAKVVASFQHESSKPRVPSPTLDDVEKEIFRRDENGETELHRSIRRGAQEAVFSTIRFASSSSCLDIRNNYRQTALHLAVASKLPLVVRRLIIAGAHPDLQDINGNSPLHLASIVGDFDTMIQLLRPISSEEQRKMMHRYKLPTLLAYRGIKLDAINFEGMAAVHLATLRGHINLLPLLKDYRADFNAQEGLCGRTPLHMAAEAGQEEMIRILVTYCGALCDVETYNGLEPYASATLNGHYNSADLLEAFGADPYVPHSIDEDTASDDEGDEMEGLQEFSRAVGIPAN
ncbi:unnamed protein product [Cyprideis torosa]|uniref:Uncharacterized protein n=1 Tax=Cyprideis torosa TaxID=163714 RepID=A0A7R8W239_9CRUS|nr:unnamed protein product [Cyprideis torosa]CAG0881539.1 unnamed protein product [Cyprideis torosa]